MGQQICNGSFFFLPSRLFDAEQEVPEKNQRWDVCEMQDITSGFMFAPLKNFDNKI